MGKAKQIFAIVKRLTGPNKGKVYKRFFKSEGAKSAALKRYASYGKGLSSATASKVGKGVQGWNSSSIQLGLGADDAVKKLVNQGVANKLFAGLRVSGDVRPVLAKQKGNLYQLKAHAFDSNKKKIVVKGLLKKSGNTMKVDRVTVTRSGKSYASGKTVGEAIKNLGTPGKKFKPVT